MNSFEINDVVREMQKTPKPVIFELLVGKCMDLAIEQLDINCNFGSDKTKIENHFKKMKKAKLIELYIDEDELLIILKNFIFN